MDMNLDIDLPTLHAIPWLLLSSSIVQPVHRVTTITIRLYTLTRHYAYNSPLRIRNHLTSTHLSLPNARPKDRNLPYRCISQSISFVMFGLKGYFSEYDIALANHIV
ncbi:predicted protein [Lichtheimia corymbifera JMRC:FSU:9682]|uniref:Uncharacterized protein n=1 Tax=Lichtheimia corymbifera JMRC:FSU:9682 TaxID=1263082 RepID=A0A068S4Y3_9FUNG|nr:predicted protein [Lichtheimia corymbifera JMRC:FSU:9682]